MRFILAAICFVAVLFVGQQPPQTQGSFSYSWATGPEFTLALKSSLSAITKTEAQADQFGFTKITGQPFESAQLWGGGFVVGQDSLSGLHVMRTDSFNGYILGDDGTWHSLITARTFAQAICNGGVAGSCFGYYPTTGTSQAYQGSAGGLIEVCVSPANTTFGYMFYGGLIFYSTNISTANPDAIIWHNSTEQVGGGFTKTADNSNATNRYNGRFMACDPNNANHLFVATAANGLWESKDGANSFAQISSSDIPTASSAGGINYSVAFDSSSGTTGGLTNTIYVWTNGTGGSGAGVYVSTTGGGTSTWTKTTGTPTTIQHMVVAATGGIVWAVTGAVGGNGALVRLPLAAGTWATEIAASNLHSVSVNPSTVNHIIAVNNGGSVFVTTTGSGGFGSLLSFSLGAGDTPWQASSATNIFGPTAGDISLDSSDNILFDGGQGIWTSPLPSAAFTWTAKVKGVIQPIGQQIVVPKSLNVIAGMQDLGSCSFTFGVAPTNCTPITQYKSLEFATGIAVSVTDPNFTVAKISPDFNGGSDYSGYSTDGFVNNYTPFNNGFVAIVAASTAINNNGSGAIRVTAPTAPLVSWSAGTGSIVCSFATAAKTSNALNGGSVACYPAAVIDSTHFDLVGSSFTTALTTIGANYELYSVPMTILSNWAGSLNITGTASDSGKIQISYMFNTNALLNGAPVRISGVLGTTEANGDWTVSNLNTTNKTFDLANSTFTNTYTGGGQAFTWQEPGGAIAAASDTNIAMVAGNQPLAPKCSTDQGKTWSDVTNAAIPAVKTTVATGSSAGATSVTVASTTGLAGAQIIQIVMDDGRYFYTSIASISSPTVNFTTAIPAGRSIANGANLYQTLGWPNAAFLNSHPLDADKVNGTFYAVNSLSGMISWAGCGATTLVNSGNVNTGAGTWQVNGAANVSLKSVPGHAGHLFWTVGPQNAPNAIAPQGLFQSCDGGTTMTFKLRNVFSAQFVGFGVPASGSSYPTIYYVGWYDATNSNTEANATFGVWRSIDNPGDCSGSGTFQQLCSDGTSGTSCPASTTWPMGLMFTYKDISGDPFTYGLVYINTGAGPIYGAYNFLLRGDLHRGAPANDNDDVPVGLNKVA